MIIRSKDLIRNKLVSRTSSDFGGDRASMRSNWPTSYGSTEHDDKLAITAAARVASSQLAHLGVVGIALELMGWLQASVR